MLGLLGALLVAAACWTPVFSETTLVAPSGFPPSAWVWEFLPVLGIFLLASLVSFSCLLFGARWWSGPFLLGLGLVGVGRFAGLMGLGLFYEDPGPGSVLGLLGGALILVAGLVSRTSEEGPAFPAAAAAVSLLGAVLVVVGWFLPTRGPWSLRPVGRLFPGSPLQLWGPVFLEPLILGVVPAVVGALALTRGLKSGMGGLLTGAGSVGVLSFAALVGGGLAIESFQIGSVVGLFGTLFVLMAGIAVSHPPRMSADEQGA